MHKITIIIQTVGYGDRTRLQDEAACPFQEKLSDSNTLSNDTKLECEGISYISSQ